MGRTHRVKRRMTATSEEDVSGADPIRNVNLADASNIVLSLNVGEAGGIRATSSRQSVRVHQRDGESHTVTETVEDDF